MIIDDDWSNTSHIIKTNDPNVKELLQWHWGMGPSIKHVLGVIEWSYVLVHNRSFISARKPSYAQKNYLCGFSDS